MSGTNFTYLRHFRPDDASCDRLQRVVDPLYVGFPYFTTIEAEQIKATSLSDGASLQMTIENTLDKKLNRRIKKRIESQDFRVCAAHDLAPIFEKAFGIHAKDIDKNSKFMTLVKKYSLELPEEEERLGSDRVQTQIRTLAQRKKKKGR